MASETRKKFDQIMIEIGDKWQTLADESKMRVVVEFALFRKDTDERPAIHATKTFDPSEEVHLKLAELGGVCTQKVTDWLEAGGPGKIRSIGKLRSMVREMLAEELGQIDELVEPMLRAGA